MNSLHYLDLIKIKERINQMETITVGRSLDPNWNRFNRKMFNTFILTALAVTLVIFSLYKKRLDLFLILKLVAASGLAVPSILKLYMRIVKITILRSLVEFAEDIFKKNYEGPQAKLLRLSVRKTKKLVNYYIILFLVSGGPIILCPLFELLVNGNYMLIVPIYIPYVNADNCWGYVVHMALQMLLGAFTYLGNMAFDLLVTLIACNFTAMVSMLEYNMEILSKMYKQNVDCSNRRKFMRNLLMQFTDVHRYISCVNNVFKNLIFLQMACTSVTVILALLLIVVDNWISGYAAVWLLLVEMLTQCYIGEIILSQKKHLCAVVYNAPWYEYDHHGKKTILMLLQMCQSLEEMQIGFYAPLKLESGAEVLKSIFSYYTALIKFLR